MAAAPGLADPDGRHAGDQEGARPRGADGPGERAAVGEGRGTRHTTHGSSRNRAADQVAEERLSEFWEDPERVQQFAEREPDHRLVALIGHDARFRQPQGARVLDLGCAGGRNTVLLARHGFDVHAVDASTAMVRRTRERVAELLGPDEARQRIRTGRMDDLSRFDDGAFHLVVALGVHHSATSWAEWQRAADETARVLRPGGLLLFNQFTPEVDLTGDGLRPTPHEPHTFDGFPAGRAVLLDATALDSEWAARHLVPTAPSETVRVDLDPGRRVSVNALYEKRQP